MFNAKDYEPIKTQKVSQQIIDRIRGAILRRDLESGQKLPNEPVLMRQFGVSRQTMREALCALESMGLLKLRAGSGGGAFVSEVGLDVARLGLSNFLYGKDFSIRHIGEVRLALEPRAAELAAVYFSPVEKRELRDLLEEDREAIERGDDVARVRRLEIAFHTYIVQATKNPIWILLHDFAENLLWDVKTQLKTQDGFSRQVLRMHERIMDAIDAENAELAASCMRQDIIEVEDALTRMAGDEALRLV